MIVLGIDPGTRESGYVLLDSQERRVLAHGVLANEELVLRLDRYPLALAKVSVLEMVGHYGIGMPAGKDVFHTCLWIGMFLGALGRDHSKLLLRPTVKAVLCGSAKAKDANVAQAVRDYFGGDELAVGGKRCSTCKGSGATGRGKARTECNACAGSTWAIPPGPLHDIRSHEWQALGAIIAYLKGAKTIESELFPSSAGDTAAHPSVVGGAVPTIPLSHSEARPCVEADLSQTITERVAVSPAEVGSLPRKEQRLMPTFFCSRRIVQTLEDDVAAVTRVGAAQIFKDRHGFWPESVADEVCVGGCEACGEAIFCDEPSTYIVDSGRFHCRCIPEDMREVVNG